MTQMIVRAQSTSNYSQPSFKRRRIGETDVYYVGFLHDYALNEYGSNFVGDDSENLLRVKRLKHHIMHVRVAMILLERCENKKYLKSTTITTPPELSSSLTSQTHLTMLKRDQGLVKEVSVHSPNRMCTKCERMLPDTSEFFRFTTADYGSVNEMKPTMRVCKQCSLRLINLGVEMSMLSRY